MLCVCVCACVRGCECCVCVCVCVETNVFENLFHSYVLMLPFLFLCHTSERKHSLVPTDGGSVFFQS